MKKWLALTVSILGIVCFSAPLSAAEFPPKMVKIVVPYPPGGPVDFTARLLAEKLGNVWNTPVLVENRSGAASTIGTNSVVKAPADGSVILITTAGLSVQPAVYDNLPYDPLRDLRPVTLLASSPSLLAVNATAPVHSAKELVEYLKKHADTPYGSQGVGSFSQLVMALFLSEAGAQALHVPYRGSSPALQALMSGETTAQIDIMMPMMPAVRDGKVRPLAVTSDTRQPLLPDVPTMAEAGFPKASITSWTGFFVPAGTPDTVVAAIDEASRQVLKDPVVVEKLANSGYQAIGRSADEFSQFFKADVDRFAQIARNGNLKKLSAQ